MKSLAKLETKHINAIIDRKADTPAAANELRKLLHIVFEWAIGAGMLTENPIKRAKRVKYVKRSHRSWTDADVEAYQQALGGRHSAATRARAVHPHRPPPQ